MTITAQNADKDAFFMVGSLDVADGEQIDISANLTKGSVRVEIVRSSDSQGIDGIPEMDGAAIISADLVRTDGASGTVPAGTYLLRAACLEKATGTIQIDVTLVEISRDDSFPLERAGSCILILAEEVKGGRFIASRNPDVTYFNHGENWFVQSGYNKNGEEIFYSKESITDKGLKTFWISYPTARREIGDSIAAEFEKNCRF